MADDFVEMRRRNRLNPPDFNPQGPTIADNGPLFPVPKVALPSTNQPEQPEQERSIDDLLDMYRPDTRATDMFINAVENIPERPEPSKWRRLGAGLSTLGPGGMEAGERVLYGPYNRAMGDFKLRADLLKDLASAERSGNANDRLIMSQILLDERSRRAQATRDAAQQETARRNAAREEIDRIRTRLLQIREDKTLSDSQRIALQNKYAQDLERLRQTGRLNLAGEQAELDQDLERLRQSGRIELEDTRQTGRETLKEMGAENEETATQQKVAQYNRARQAFNTHPEWKKFIKLGSPGTNDFTLTPRSVFLSSYRPEAQEEANKDYDAMMKYIYGEGAAETPEKPRVTKKTTSKTVIRQRNKRTGQIRESTDGGKTWRIVNAPE